LQFVLRKEPRERALQKRVIYNQQKGGSTHRAGGNLWGVGRRKNERVDHILKKLAEEKKLPVGFFLGIDTGPVDRNIGE